MKERFDKEAKDWDKLDRRVINAKNIANIIKQSVELKKDMHLMDFGAGTGLLSEFLSQNVGCITAVDNSKGMIDEFLKKDLFCKTKAFCMDYENTNLDDRFDGIVSSMTIHHIKDIENLFNKFYTNLKEDAFLAIADLDKEDGSFHTSNDGVYHFGFDFNNLKDLANKASFKNIIIKSCGFIKKPHGDFEVKCLIAKR